MKKLLVVLMLLCGVTLALAEYYTVYGVRRVDDDLYRSGNLYIETQFCFYYAYGEDAVLKWVGPYGNNKIIWRNDTSCKVRNVFRK